MIATILTVGQELLIGQIADTNAVWLSRQLYDLGVLVRRVVTVGDRDRAIRDALAQEWPKSDLLVITGGLGPTSDDLTREAVGRYFERELQCDQEAVAIISQHYTRHGRRMPSACIRMAMIPAGFKAVHNSAGVAPGLFYEDASDRTLFAVPGVPLEMKAIFHSAIKPHIARKGLGRVVVHRILCTAGVSETVLADKLSDLVEEHEIAFLPAAGRVKLRLTAMGIGAREKLHRLEAMVRTRIGNKCIFGTGRDTLQKVVGTLLRDKGYSIAEAESCTGGRTLDKLTNVAGSSDYLRGGVVAYANATKVDVLGVQTSTLRRHGAVSKAVALEMAGGVRAKMHADIGLSITGVAGPGGGTSEKPVGTIWIGYADAGGTEARRHRLGKHRRRNKEASAILALNMVRRKLANSKREYGLPK